MISAERYAADLGSYWRTLLPMLDGFVRSVNRAPFPYRPVSMVQVIPGRSSLVSELAFEVLRESVSTGTDVHLLFRDQEVLRIAADKARARIAKLDGKPLRQVEPVGSAEVMAAAELAGSTQQLLAEEHKSARVLIGLPLAGCGFVDAAEADALAGETLYEMKAVQRSFRGADFRQVLVYAALNYAARTYDISEIGLMNPRQRHVYRLSIDSFARLAAGMSGGELLAEVVEGMSRPGTSR